MAFEKVFAHAHLPTRLGRFDLGRFGAVILLERGGAIVPKIVDGILVPVGAAVGLLVDGRRLRGDDGPHRLGPHPLAPA